MWNGTMTGPKLLLTLLSACIALTPVASPSADDAGSSAKQNKEVCGACYESCAFAAIDCREQACRSAGGKPMPGTCYGAQDDPERSGAAEKCGTAFELCKTHCAATNACQTVQ